MPREQIEAHIHSSKRFCGPTDLEECLGRGIGGELIRQTAMFADPIEEGRP